MDASVIKLRLGETIRALRTERGYSQEELAFQSGLHRTYIGSLERGERNVAIVNIVRIAEALDTTAGQLVQASKL